MIGGIDILPSGQLGRTMLLLVYLFVSAGGLALLKAAVPLSAAFFLGMALYGLGFGIWYAILMVWPLSSAFPLAAGGLIVTTQVFGMVFLGESLSPMHLFGGALIVGGIGVIYTSR
jgi:drug/metabolite transporter (DMT)-like permease